MADYSSLKVILQGNSGAEHFYVPYDDFIAVLKKTKPSFAELKRNVREVSDKWDLSPLSQWNTNWIGFYGQKYGKHVRGQLTGNEALYDIENLLCNLKKWDKKGWKIEVAEMTSRFPDLGGIWSSSY